MPRLMGPWRAGWVALAVAPAKCVACSNVSVSAGLYVAKNKGEKGAQLFGDDYRDHVQRSRALNAHLWVFGHTSSTSCLLLGVENASLATDASLLRYSMITWELASPLVEV